ncbi:nephrocystin-3 [Prunus yedoensis var. nudiflora]|uniref:Nephrocystin-3 n=1 Tax=Prunus yedoensis var. nudiflora TaxID=2094558 RepID=A0A314Y4D9_PRUYE|nr:nephrocystin-3 [Prunus yedoensis var. nudiflora]
MPGIVEEVVYESNGNSMPNKENPALNGFPKGTMSQQSSGSTGPDRPVDGVVDTSIDSFMRMCAICRVLISHPQDVVFDRMVRSLGLIRSYTILLEER